MTIEYKKYLVWQCPKCGRWQSRQNNNWCYGMSEHDKIIAISKTTLSCIRCRNRKKLKCKDIIGLSVKAYHYDSPQEATEVVQQLSMRKERS